MGTHATQLDNFKHGECRAMDAEKTQAPTGLLGTERRGVGRSLGSVAVQKPGEGVEGGGLREGASRAGGGIEPVHPPWPVQQAWGAGARRGAVWRGTGGAWEGAPDGLLAPGRLHVERLFRPAL